MVNVQPGFSRYRYFRGTLVTAHAALLERWPVWKLAGFWRIKVSCATARLRWSVRHNNSVAGSGRMSTLTMTHAPKGLEGVVATTSKICYIDGERGVLAYRGIDIHELAEKSTFEETCYLLWYGKLPDELELKKLRQRLASERKI